MAFDLILAHLASNGYVVVDLATTTVAINTHFASPVIRARLIARATAHFALPAPVIVYDLPFRPSESGLCDCGFIGNTVDTCEMCHHRFDKSRPSG